MMRTFVILFLGLFFLSANPAFSSEAIPSFPSETKVKWSFKDQEISSLIEMFAKESKTTFIVDPGVRGKISIFTAQPVTLDEAFDLLATALAQNGFAIVPREGRYVVMAARNAQRSSIPTLTEIKSVKPERYVTLLINLKHISALEANKNLRAFPSKDGEMTPIVDSNQLLVTDYISNLNRIAEMLKLLDQPVAPGAAKFAKTAKVNETAVTDEAAKSAKKVK